MMDTRTQKQEHHARHAKHNYRRKRKADGFPTARQVEADKRKTRDQRVTAEAGRVAGRANKLADEQAAKKTRQLLEQVNK